jgi:hypothetical protein
MDQESYDQPAPDAAAGWATGAATPIAQDTPCRKCGYNLRGLTADGRCPECGTSVGYSLQGDLLRFCDPSWVDLLRRGVTFIITAVVVAIVGVVIAFAMGVSAGVQGVPTAVVVGSVLVILAMILATVGWWLLTSPDPSGLGEDQYGRSRKIIRVAQVVGVIQLGLSFVSTTMTFDDATLMGLRVLVGIGILVNAVGIIAECAYLEKLARRIPDDRLSGRAHFLMWALGITYGLSQLISAVVNVVGVTARASRDMMGFACFTGILNLVVLVFFIMFLLLLEKMGKRFKQEAAAARQTWAARPFEPPPAGQGEALPG